MAAEQDPSAMSTNETQQQQQQQQQRQGQAEEGQHVDAVADVAQAYRELARGEQTATTLELNLTNLESKLDAILAALEATGGDTKDVKQPDGTDTPSKDEKP